MKRFDHKKIEQSICEKFNLKSYKKGNFTHFFNSDANENKNEIGYIEKISGGSRYLYTFLISFFDLENLPLNDEIVNFATDQYKAQKKLIDQAKQGVNICLELRGSTITKATLI